MEKGESSILAELTAHHPRFQFGKRSFEKLLMSALHADVDLEDLQRILNLVPQAYLNNRVYFMLIQWFDSKRMWTEVLHCYQQMQAANLKLTPAMERTLKVVLDNRAVASRQQ